MHTTTTTSDRLPMTVATPPEHSFNDGDATATMHQRRRETAAARIDQSIRRSKVLSRAGLDDPVFHKMSQLERLVQSLQSALNNQSLAIHDVHGQLSEINDVLHTMQSKSPEPSAVVADAATSTPEVGAVDIAAVLDDVAMVTAIVNGSVDSVEPEQLVRDLQVTAAKYAAERRKEPRTAPSDICTAASSNNDTPTIPPVAAEHCTDDDDDEDAFEDAEDDGDYLRLCSMLEQLITDASIAVETPISATFSAAVQDEPVDTDNVLDELDTLVMGRAAQLADDTEIDHTWVMAKPAENIADMPGTDDAATPSESPVQASKESLLRHRRRQKSARRRESGACVQPVLLQNVHGIDDDEDGHFSALSSPTTATATAPNVELDSADLEDEVGLVDMTAPNAPDAVEVRFYCQVTRTGGTTQQHEIRRRLVLPLITSANLTPGNMRRIMSGQVMADTKADRATAMTMTHGRSTSVIRRALGTVQLMYWLLLFTLGVLMLDAYLCELAGAQAVEVVDGIRTDDDNKQRRRPRGLLRAAASSQSTDLPPPVPLQYTGMKPIPPESPNTTASAPLQRDRSRRNSF